MKDMGGGRGHITITQCLPILNHAWKGSAQVTTVVAMCTVYIYIVTKSGGLWVRIDCGTTPLFQ